MRFGCIVRNPESLAPTFLASLWVSWAPFAMPPAKARTNHEDAKLETSNSKDKNGHGTASQQPNGKLRRVGSIVGSQLRDVTNAASLPESAITSPAVPQEVSSPAIQWTSFDRKVLHAYRRVYRLNAPTTFANEYRRWVLSQPGSVGLRSPTMAKRKDLRRQSKEQLANAARKHFNGLGTQENDIVVEFLHKARSQGGSKLDRVTTIENHSQDMER